MSFEKTKKFAHDMFDLDLWVKNIKEHAPHVSAETMGWAVLLLLESHNSEGFTQYCNHWIWVFRAGRHAGFNCV